MRTWKKIAAVTTVAVSVVTAGLSGMSGRAGAAVIQGIPNAVVLGGVTMYTYDGAGCLQFSGSGSSGEAVIKGTSCNVFDWESVSNGSYVFLDISNQSLALGEVNGASALVPLSSASIYFQFDGRYSKGGHVYDRMYFSHLSGTPYLQYNNNGEQCTFSYSGSTRDSYYLAP